MVEVPVKFKLTDTYLATVQGIYFTVVSLDIIIYTVWVTFMLRKFWKLRKEAFFEARYPKLTVVQAISTGIYFFLLRVIADLPKILPSVTYGSPVPEVYIRVALYNLIHVIFVIIFIRLWFLYYNYHRGLQLVFEQFATRITDDLSISSSRARASSEWTVKYRKWLSPSSNAIYYIGAGWVVFVQFIVLLCVSFRRSAYAQMAFYIAASVVFLVIGLKIRSCRDELALRREAVLLGCDGLFMMIFFGLFWFIFDDEMKALLHQLVMSAGVMVAVYITFNFVYQQYEKRLAALNCTESRSPSVSLQDVLKHEDAFELFAYHCVKEFNIENLLFVFEAMKFKRECCRFGFIDEDEMGLQIEFAPKARRVTRDKSTIKCFQDFEYNFVYILNKYFDEESESCINVAFLTRKRIHDKWQEMASQQTATKGKSGYRVPSVSDIASTMDVAMEAATTHKLHSADEMNEEQIKQDILQCIHLLDEAMHEILSLLRLDSLYRFASTPEYQRVFGDK